MYEITKEFVDEQIRRRFSAASTNDQAHVENATRALVDVRATFLKLAISTTKLRAALFEDCDDISNAALIKDVLDVRKKVDKVTEDVVNAEIGEVDERVEKLLSTDEAIVLAIANYNLGLIHRKHSDIKMFLYTDEDYFITCELLLNNNKTEPKAVITMMKAFDQLHDIYWHEVSYCTNEYLGKMLELYIEYVEQDNRFRKPINLAVELGIEKSYCTNSDLTELDVMFLHCFAIFMDVYAANKNQSTFVVCLHRILQYQLPIMVIFNVTAAWEWISTLCEMSIYFMKHERFAEAKNYIATAEYVLTNYHDCELNGGKQWSDADRTYLLARFDFMRCVISRFWGIYGIELLASSTQRLLLSAVTDKKIEDDLEPSLFAKKPMSPLLFTNIEDSMKDSVRNMRTQVLHVRDAKEVVLTVINNFKKARETCFSATNNIKIYTNITIELSKTYKFLAFFEKENEAKIKLCTKRIKILTDLIDKNRQICAGVHGKISLHLALANYSSLDTAFGENVIRKILNTKSYYLTDYITTITSIRKHLRSFEVFAQNI